MLGIIIRMISFNKLIKYWLPVLIYLIVIFLFSDHPTVTVTTIDWGDFFFKKTVHFFEYAFLFILFYRAFRTLSIPFLKIVILSFVFTILYAISDELHQVFIPGRTGTLRDVLIDSAGVTSAFIYIWKYLPKGPEKLKNWAKRLELI